MEMLIQKCLPSVVMSNITVYRNVKHMIIPNQQTAFLMHLVEFNNTTLMALTVCVHSHCFAVRGQRHTFVTGIVLNMFICISALQADAAV